MIAHKLASHAPDRPLRRKIQRGRKAVDELIQLWPFVCLFETDPQRDEFAVEEIQRDCSHGLEGLGIDARIKMGIERGSYDADLISGAELHQRQAFFHLLVRHAEPQSE